MKAQLNRGRALSRQITVRDEPLAPFPACSVLTVPMMRLFLSSELRSEVKRGSVQRCGRPKEVVGALL